MKKWEFDHLLLTNLGVFSKSRGLFLSSVLVWCLAWQLPRGRQEAALLQLAQRNSKSSKPFEDDESFTAIKNPWWDQLNHAKAAKDKFQQMKINH